MKHGGESESDAQGSTPFIMRPIPLALLAYAFLLAVVQIAVGVSTGDQNAVADFDRQILGFVRVSHVLLVLHCGWLALMLLEFRSALHSPPGLRKGHVGGALAGVVLAAALCVWALRLAHFLG